MMLVGGGGRRYSLGVFACILGILSPAKIGRSPFCLSKNVHDEKVAVDPTLLFRR